MSQISYRGGHDILESMARTTRSTPAPPAEAVPTDGTAPVSASPLAMPDPKPRRALAFIVDPQTPLENVPCFTPGPLGAGMVPETGSSCAVGSRHEIACSLGWVATKVPPRPVHKYPRCRQLAVCPGGTRPNSGCLFLGNFQGHGPRLRSRARHQPEGDVRPLPSPAAVLHATPGRVAAGASSHGRGQTVRGGGV